MLLGGKAFGPYFCSDLLESHFMPKCDYFFTNLMVNYDQTVPKLYVEINILMEKNHVLTENEVEKRYSRIYVDQYFGSYCLSIHSFGLCENILSTPLYVKI
jgi:hypothetical protein